MVKEIETLCGMEMKNQMLQDNLEKQSDEVILSREMIDLLISALMSYEAMEDDQALLDASKHYGLLEFVSDSSNGLTVRQRYFKFIKDTVRDGKTD